MSKYIVDIPDRHKYAIEIGIMKNGSLASKVILDAVKDGIPYVERPHGVWIESKERKGHFYCSECIHQDVSGKWRELFDFKYNFCPNCGKRMEEGDENDTGRSN